MEGLLDAYLRERKLRSKSEAEIRAAYRRFGAIVGLHKLAREVTKADARAYKESLLAAPSNRALSTDGKLSAKSVKKLLDGVSAQRTEAAHGTDLRQDGAALSGDDGAGRGGAMY